MHNNSVHSELASLPNLKNTFTPKIASNPRSVCTPSPTRSASMGRLGSFRPIPFFGAAILWTTLLLLMLTEVEVVCGQQEGLPPPCPLCLQKPPRIPGIPHEKQHKHENQKKKKPREAHETPKALTDLRQYLQQYGYLETPPLGKAPVLKEMGEAIGLFQRCFGLPETKSLDAITYQKISQPRCGQPDYVGAQPDRSVARKFAPFLRANIVGRPEELSTLTDNSGFIILPIFILLYCYGGFCPLNHCIPLNASGLVVNSSNR